MKVVVLNNTGNVGKSFIAREVIYANLPEPKIILDFETYNLPNCVFKGVDSRQFNRKTFKEMLRTAAFTDNVVIDVGSSNITDFFEEMKKYCGELMDYDYFVVPTVLDDKQDSDTLKVLDLLAAFGLQEKTRIIFNRVSSISQDILSSKVARKAGELKLFFCEKMRIEEHSTVNEITGARLTLAEILDDSMDYRAAALATEDTEKRKRLYDKHLLKVSAVGLRSECQNVWKLLNE